MLHKFLKAIQSGEVQSVLEIARRMEVSPEMVLQMAKDLTKRGYLQEIDADCCPPESTCSDCPARSGCQVIAKHWFLTEKGKSAIS